MIIELPQVGESISEGVIGKWLKNVGDSVEKFDPLVEIITDKVAMELPSPISGILKEIIVAEGQTVPIGAEIANIESEHDNEVSAPPESSIQSLRQIPAVPLKFMNRCELLFALCSTKKWKSKLNACA